MIEIGYSQRLLASRRAPPGVYMTSGESEVLLPNRHVPASLELGTELEVFVYTDSSDRPVATTQKPHAEVGHFAALRVVDLSPHGVFMDWGLDKDLFVPFAEQEQRMQRGEVHVVAVCLDEQTQRVIGSSRLTRFFDAEPPEFPADRAVDLIVYRQSELGAHVVVEQLYGGLIHRVGGLPPLGVGERATGYVRQRRPDGKLDISLEPEGALRRDLHVDRLTRAIHAAGGELALHDNSTPEEVAAALQMSKKAFKRAAGILYKQRLIALTPAGLKWLTRDTGSPRAVSADAEGVPRTK